MSEAQVEALAGELARWIADLLNEARREAWETAHMKLRVECRQGCEFPGHANPYEKGADQ